MKYYTSIEQSKKLLELGLSPESADMHYILIGDIDGGNIINSDMCPLEVGKPYNKLTLPAWSLGALLEVMPTTLPLYPEATEEGVKEGKYRRSDLIAAQEGHLRKRFDDTYQYRYDGIHIVGDYDNPLQAVYSMVIWLLENNYIKK